MAFSSLSPFLTSPLLPILSTRRLSYLKPTRITLHSPSHRLSSYSTKRVFNTRVRHPSKSMEADLPNSGIEIILSIMNENCTTLYYRRGGFIDEQALQTFEGTLVPLDDFVMRPSSRSFLLVYERDLTMADLDFLRFLMILGSYLIILIRVGDDGSPPTIGNFVVSRFWNHIPTIKDPHEVREFEKLVRRIYTDAVFKLCTSATVVVLPEACLFEDTKPFKEEMKRIGQLMKNILEGEGKGEEEEEAEG